MTNHRSRFPERLYITVGATLALWLASPGDAIATYLPPQASSLASLRSVSLSPVQVTYHSGFPASVLMEVPASGATPRDRARSFLDEYADFYLQSHPDVALIYSQSGFTAEEGETVRFAQTYRGLPVFGAEIVVHVSSDTQGPQRVFRTVGRLFIPARTSTTAPIEPVIDLAPEISASQAEAAARLAMGAATTAARGETLLMLYDPSLLDQPGPPRLVWRVVLGTANSFLFLIDADDAAVLYQEQQTETAAGLADLDFQVIDAEAMNMADTVCFNLGGTLIGDEGGLYPGAELADPEASVAWNAARATYLMFHDSFGRHSYDDDDAELILGVHANLGPMEPNASAGSWCGIQFSNGFVANDVLAHEFGHLVIDETSDLVGGYEPGTLNESYSDTMAILVDSADWILGESMTFPSIAGTGLRDFQTPTNFNCQKIGDPPGGPFPTPCPDRYSLRNILPMVVDNGGVHINAGVTNKAFFLMANGGTFNGRFVTGMGRAKMGKIAHRAFINLPCNAGFTTLRNQAIGVAQFMNVMNQGITAQNVCSVKNAFAAVELGPGDADCDGVDDSSTDSDSDGILDDGDFSGNTVDDRCKNGNTTFCDDNCPDDENQDQANFDGDWIGDICDLDDDNDGMPDAIDPCPNANGPGDTNDTDGDTVPDCLDPDDDADGILDDGDGSGVAGDNACQDGAISNCDDNCRWHHNTNQFDGNSNDRGDACDPDQDGDGLYVLEDNCTFVFNPGQEDADSDGAGDACDKCPNVYDAVNAYTYPVAGEDPEPYQPDSDGDGIPDACDNLGFSSTGMLNNGQPYGAFNVVAPTGTTSILQINGAAGAGQRVRLAFPACETGDPAGVEANERVEIALGGLPPDIRGWIEDGRGRVVGRFRPNNSGTAHGLRFRPRCHERYAIVFETLAAFDGQEAFTATAAALVPSGQNPWSSNAALFSDPPPLPPDQDGDGLWDASDTCLAVPDPTNADADRDGVGDACDAAPGGPVTLVFSGIVTAVDHPPDTIVPGIPFTGRMIYDTTMRESSSDWPLSRTYVQASPFTPLELSVVVGGFTYSAGPDGPFTVKVENGSAVGGDQFVVSSPDIAERSTAMERLTLTLGDPSATALSSLALPPSLDLADFADATVQIDLDSGVPATSSHLTLRITAVSPPYREGRLYWLDTTADVIKRAGLDGSNAVTLVTADDPVGFEVDPLGDRIYWTEGGPGRIRRSALDGSGAVELATGAGSPFGIALDPPGGSLIFANIAFAGGLSAVTVGGGAIAPLISVAPNRPYGVAVDSTAGKLYWTETGAVPRIRRANLDGSGPELLVDGSIAPLVNAQAIALDLPAGRIYWTDLGLDRIYRATLDGGGQTLLADFTSAGLRNPTGIALDTQRGKLYWADSDRDLIQRANLDGTLVETVLSAANGLSNPRDLFVDSGTECRPPTEPLVIDGAQTIGRSDLRLSITDPNAAGTATGTNLYRATRPHLPVASWPLVALDAPDENAFAPGVQWTDRSGNPPAGTIWYYKAAAWNADCPLEGPQ